MKLWGYRQREDGTFEKRVEFVDRGGRQRLYCVEMLIRSASGRLLRVERTKRALAHRKL